MRKHPTGKQISGIFNRGGRWYVKIKVRGRQIWRSAPTRDAAQLLLGRLREDAARERVGLPRVQRATLADFAPRYLEWAKAHKRSWNRDARNLRALIAAFGDLRLGLITRARVESYMRERRATETAASARARERGDTSSVRTLAPATVNREIACLRRLLNYAVEVGELDTNPIQGIRLFAEPPARLPTLSAEDEARILDAVPDWMRLFVRVALLTGMRQGEIIALRWRDVDFDSGTLIVADSKSGVGRTVPMHPALCEALRPLRGLPDGFVVPMPPSRDGDLVSHTFKAAVRRIGRPDLRFHDLRHVAATRLLAAGASLPEVATILGHKTLDIARRYAHVTPSRLASLVASLPVTETPR